MATMNSAQVIIETMSAALSMEHHALLQYVLAQRVASEESVLAFQRSVAQVCALPVPADPRGALDAMVSVLNGALESVSLRIAHVVDDQAGELDDERADANDQPQAQQQQLQQHRVVKYYAVINTSVDEAIKLGTEFKAKELHYFRQLVDKLVRAMHCTHVDALNAADMIESFTKADAEAALDRLTAERWLFRSKRGDYALGVRTALELLPYIEQQYGGDALPVCTICHAAVLRGAQCPTAQCSVRLHLHCALEWFASKEASLCLSCNAPWNRALPVRLQQQIADARNARANQRRLFNGPVLD
jgi:hypothetical protein